MAHVTTIKVRGYHLDLYGHVNNARWLELLEEARWRLLEQTFDVEELHRAGLGFVAVKIAINYRRPARLGDELAIESTVATLGAKSGVLRQEVTRRQDGEPLADADVTFVVIDRNLEKAVPIEGDIRALFETHLRPGRSGA